MSHPCDPKQSSDNANAILLLRGALAAPSGREDDPHRRVFLSQVADPALPGAMPRGAALLELPGTSSGASDDERRAAIREAVTRFRTERGRDAEFVRLSPSLVVGVERPAVTSAEPLRDKVALVTGAGGAIGAGICRGLVEKGARVAATDIAQANLDGVVAELAPQAGNRIRGVRMDVTDPDSVAAAFDSVVEMWGGVDIIVVNAGIAMVAPLMEMELAAFRKVQAVNVDGTLLTLAEAGRRLCRQGTGGDIVLISTKNVFAPGAQFGAYSATKAASHQLARIASLEFAPYGIRVNMVAPDAVFGDGAHKSGLLAAVGPSRMRARGLD